MRSSSTPPDPDVAIAVLAAGLSKRFGGGKLHADLGGAPLWRWAVAAAEEAGFARRILIVSADTAPQSTPPGWQIVTNREAGEGIASSIRLAVMSAREQSRLVLALADMPFVPAEHLRRVAHAAGPVFTEYPDGRSGIPAGFPANAFGRLLGLKGNAGAGSLNWPDAEPGIRPAWDHALIDVDTPADLAAAGSRVEQLGLRGGAEG